MRREELRKKLLLVLENWEEQHPEGTQELLLYLRGKRGERVAVDSQLIQAIYDCAKGTLAGIGEWLRERGLGGFTIRLGWTEPRQKIVRTKVKEGLAKMHEELPEPQKTTLVRLLQQISPLVKESLKEFTPEEIAIAILERSLDSNPRTGSKAVPYLLAS